MLDVDLMALAGSKLELHRGDETTEEGCVFAHTGDPEKGFLTAHSNSLSMQIGLPSRYTGG